MLAKRTSIACFLLATTLISTRAAAGGLVGHSDEEPGFSATVIEHFDDWDANKDGELSIAEIDCLSVDPSIVGEEAAAVAAIKVIVRGGKYELPPLTWDYLATRPDDDHPVPITDRLDESDAAKGKEPPFRARYQAAVRKLRSTPRELFADATPDLEQAHQGPLGDCFFVSVVGAAVERENTWVKQAITPKVGGGYTVAFGNGQTVDVTPLTDVELAISSRVGNEGLWLSVLEKAYGQLRNQTKPEAQRAEQAIDAIAKGGAVGTTIKALTGHDVESVAMRTKAEKAKDAQELAPLLDRVRTVLKTATEAKRLIAASTGANDKVPPGMSAKHAYAVLGYDESRDVVKIWNPHGNTFKPKGKPGIEHGYATKSGRFELSTEEFARIFRSVTVETDRVASSPTRSRPAR